MKSWLLVIGLVVCAILRAQEPSSTPASACMPAESSDCLQRQLTALRTEVDELKERLDRIPGEREAEIQNALFLLELPQTQAFEALVRRTVGYWKGGTTRGGTYSCRELKAPEHYEPVLLERSIDIGRRKGECMPPGTKECDSHGERCEDVVIGGCYVRSDLVARMKREKKSSRDLVSMYCPDAISAFDHAVNRVITGRRVGRLPR